MLIHLFVAKNLLNTAKYYVLQTRQSPCILNRNFCIEQVVFTNYLSLYIHSIAVTGCKAINKRQIKQQDCLHCVPRSV